MSRIDRSYYGVVKFVRFHWSTCSDKNFLNKHLFVNHLEKCMHRVYINTFFSALHDVSHKHLVLACGAVRMQVPVFDCASGNGAKGTRFSVSACVYVGCIERKGKFLCSVCEGALFQLCV